ncbi:MAG: ATP-binding protein [Pleurocapsa sp. MO_226.B13]|nr:ATP-binding protein [Pleurocapsa sp. MO_226.B13]
MSNFQPSKHFLVIENDKEQSTLHLESETYSIGRDPHNSIILNAPKISRYHATLLRIAIAGTDSYQFRIIDGNLKGKRSRNGFKVNGKSCLSYDLQDGDVIDFGDRITATYKTETITRSDKTKEPDSFFEEEDQEDQDATCFLGSLNNSSGHNQSPQTVNVSEEERQKSIQQSLERLASFPELFSDPIIEIDLNGNITYLNPAALKCFPNLKKEKLQHPLLANIIPLLKAQAQTLAIREVRIGDRVFEQSIHLISASQLVRCYVSDITKRKQAEILLKNAHQELEQRVKKRTVELAYNNEVLKAEIAERKQIEQEIRLLQTITQSISEAANFDEAISITLRKVCETVNWSFGEAWIPDLQENVLKLSPSWYSSTDRLKDFREASKKLNFSLNIGKPGRVWATKQSEWTDDVSLQPSKIFLRSKIARVVGLKNALGVPITVNEKVIAVFVFFDFSASSENRQIVELVKSVAAQLGLVIEHKKAEDALRSSMATNKALINAIPDLLFRIDKDCIIVNFKAAKEKNLLTPKGEFLGRHISAVFPSEISSSIINSVNKVFATGKLQILECQILDEDKIYSYEVRIANSDIDEVMAIVRDISDRKQAETNIRQNLEREKKLNELKSRFVTMASHEFRTPLASILSSSELLEHYSHKWSEEKKLSHLYRIQNSVKRMTELLNDVLLLGKADAGKLELNPSRFNLFKFCHELVEEIQLTTTTHQINFQVEKCSQANVCAQQSDSNKCDLFCMDEKLLRHILTNLLSNAVKYSPESDKVDFSVTCQSRQAIFQVRDFGIGIPPEEQNQLFDSFHRAANVGSIPGTGLGLPIVKRAVDLHGGTISIASQLGFGTTFTVTLPFLITQ